MIGIPIWLVSFSIAASCYSYKIPSSITGMEVFRQLFWNSIYTTEDATITKHQDTESKRSLLHSFSIPASSHSSTSPSVFEWEVSTTSPTAWTTNLGRTAATRPCCSSGRPKKTGCLPGTTAASKWTTLGFTHYRDSSFYVVCFYLLF